MSLSTKMSINVKNSQHKAKLTKGLNNKSAGYFSTMDSTMYLSVQSTVKEMIFQSRKAIGSNSNKLHTDKGSMSQAD